MLVLKSLIQVRSSEQQSAPSRVIQHLARHIDEFRHPQARACVLWLVGQYAASDGDAGIKGIAEWAPDVLRKSAKSFRQQVGVPSSLQNRSITKCANKAANVKLQTLTLAAKLIILAPDDQTLVLLNQYVFAMARYDSDYDVRDRCRMLSSLLSGVILGLAQEGDASDDQGGVVLRREQVRLVLFEGKSGTLEKATPFGRFSSAR